VLLTIIPVFAWAIFTVNIGGFVEVCVKTGLLPDVKEEVVAPIVQPELLAFSYAVAVAEPVNTILCPTARFLATTAPREAPFEFRKETFCAVVVAVINGIEAVVEPIVTVQFADEDDNTKAATSKFSSSLLSSFGQFTRKSAIDSTKSVVNFFILNHILLILYKHRLFCNNKTSKKKNFKKLMMILSQFRSVIWE